MILVAAINFLFGFKSSFSLAELKHYCEFILDSERHYERKKWLLPLVIQILDRGNVCFQRAFKLSFDEAPEEILDKKNVS